MAKREDIFETCEADCTTPACAEYYPCSICDGNGKVSDGYEYKTCPACGGTGCGFASVCGCDEED
jgi:hypothetical protein